MYEKADILLVGNPNVGKSTIFNALTGLKQHTGNWTGKTVSSATGKLHYGNKNYTVADTPGTYSLFAVSPEEEAAIQTLCKNPDALTVVIADATCLSRNLFLLFQVTEACRHTVLCVNLIDEAKRNNIYIDINKLSHILGIPVIAANARNRKSIKHFKEFIITNLKNKPNTQKLLYPEKIANALASIICQINSANTPIYNADFIAQTLLFCPTLGKELLNDIKCSEDEITLLFNYAKKQKSILLQEGITPIKMQELCAEALNKRAKFAADNAVKKQPGEKLSPPNAADRILTSKIFGIPIMIAFMCLLLWVTIFAANIPSEYLSRFFSWLRPHFSAFLNILKLPDFWFKMLTDGVYTILTWVISVMLPPMAIFFPLFTLLEDLGYLPRIAFNLDKYFKKSGSNGKQALTMCMGLGCNAVGVTGCRIISSHSERMCAMLTNTFIPCNGRFGLLILLSSIIAYSFCGAQNNLISAFCIVIAIILGITVTLAVTKLLSKLCFKDNGTSFVLELPRYRKPQVIKTLYRSLVDRTLTILGRAVTISAPAGAIIWFLAVTNINGYSILQHCEFFLNPIGQLMGLDGAIILAFILALPANEIAMPILIMCYLSSSSPSDLTDINILSELFCAHGWDTLTAINMGLFSLLHFPCGTTLYTVYKETHSVRLTVFSFILPTAVAVSVCCLTNLIWHVFV